MRSIFTRPPNTSSFTSTVPTFSFWLLTTSTVMTAPAGLKPRHYIADLKVRATYPFGRHPRHSRHARHFRHLFLPSLLLLLLLLRLRLRLCCNSFPNEHVAAIGTRDIAAHHDDVVLGVDAKHFEIANRDAVGSHVTVHPHAEKHARRIRRRADRTGRTMEHR